MKATPQSSNNNAGMHNQNGGRSASSPHASRQLAMSQAQHQQNAGVHEKQNTLAPSALEPATLDLTGSNSNSSVQVSSVASSGGGHNTHPNEVNGGSGIETATIGERKESAVSTAKNLSLNISTTDKRSPSTSPTVAAKDSAVAYNMSVSNNADDPARQCSPNSAMSTSAEPHTSVSPPAKPTIGVDSIGGAGHGAGVGSGNYSNNSKVTAVPSDNIVKPTTDPSTGVFAPNTQSVPPNETVLPVVGATTVKSTATPTNTNTSTYSHTTSPSTTTPDTCASVGGVTSTTGGSTSPPVVSSSTNIVNNKTQQKTNCDETVSSATSTTTTAAIEVNGGGGAAAAAGGGGR